MNDPLILVDGVSKKLCRDLRRSLWYGLGDLVSDVVGVRIGASVLRPSEFWAVRGVGFQLRRGECLGLIGRNGAGKTTLLRMLSGLIRPTTGSIEMHGDVGAMIALGAGVKDVLSGRENIYAMAALRGMSRQAVEGRVDEIIDFAEIREAIDAPLRSYSSGMRVRLNFAVASTLEPDILLLDEVLAVGDAAFRNKCYRRIAELRRHAAVIFVSHNMEQVARVCTHTLVMDRGQVVYAGAVDGGIRAYGALNADRADGLPSDAFLSVDSVFSDFSLSISQTEMATGDPLVIDLSVTADKPMAELMIKVLFYNVSGAFVADGCVDSSESSASIGLGKNKIRISVNSLPLKNGVYFLAVNVIDSVGDIVIWSYKKHQIEISGAYAGGIADCQLRLNAVSIVT